MPAHAMSPKDRSERARIAAHKLHATHDSRQITSNARAAFLDRFAREVDPEGVLTPDERARRAAHAKTAYFRGLALKSAQKRRRGAQTGAEE